MKKHILIRLFMALLPFTLCGNNHLHLIKGKVVDSTGAPIPFAMIIHRDHLITETNSQGNFLAKLHLPCQIRVYAVEYQDTLVRLNTEDSVIVHLHEQKVELEAVQIVGKRIRDKIIAQQTSLEVSGSYYHIRSQLRIPAKMLGNAYRICLQAYLETESDSSKIWLKPIVLDGNEYRSAQLRLHAFDLQKDPLFNYLGRFEGKNSDLVIRYSDSIPTAIGQKQWKGKLSCHVVDFLNTRYQDSMLFVRGIINPLRWMQIDLNPIELTDSLFLPRNQLAWHKESGKQFLQFKVNRPELDTTDSSSQAHFLHILQQLRLLLCQDDVRVQRISIRGYASPEGSYEKNKTLAQARAQYVYKALLQDSIVQNKLKTHYKIQHLISSDVHSWTDVLALAKQEEPSLSVPSQEMIKIKYLPQFRYVSYSIEYTVFRSLNKQELFQAFVDHPNQFCAHDYYRLIQYAKTDDGKNHPTTWAYIQKALTQFPTQWWFRNEAFRIAWEQDSLDLAIRIISIDSPSTPYEIFYHLGMAYWKKNQFKEAGVYLQYCLKSRDHSLQQLAENKWGQLLALQGQYQQAWPIVSKRPGLDRILLRLALHQNEAAYHEMLVEMNAGSVKNAITTDSSFAGLEQYVMAICAHRINHIEESVSYLKAALCMNPRWKEIACSDGDLMDLIPLLKTY